MTDYVIDGQHVPGWTAFVHDGIQYPPNWLDLASSEERAALGAVPVVQQERPDDRYGVVNPDPAVPGAWTFVAFPTEQLKERLCAHAAAARYAKETGGIAFNGVPIRTDRESQAMVSGAHSLVVDRPEKTIKFKSAGGFVELDAATMTAIARAVGDHVQECFAIEADVAGKIMSGEIATYDAVEAEFA